MTKRTRIALIVAAGIVLLPAAAFSVHGWLRVREMSRDLLPHFVDVPEGPRAPTTHALGLQVGRTSLAEAQELLKQHGLRCPDTSMRALMQNMREQKRQEMTAREQRGEDPDAVTGASLVRHRSPKERNPQVRLSCEGVTSQTLWDRRRTPSRGRLLLIFDSPTHPLRHVSFERTFASIDVALAVQDLVETESALLRQHGPSPRASDPGFDPAAGFGLLKPVEYAWAYADLVVRVRALSYGARGVVVSEMAEVPWPVRTDGLLGAKPDQPHPPKT